MKKKEMCAIINLTEDDKDLKPLTNMRPIAALPFASRYRIIDFVLSSISYANIESVALFIAKSGRSIYDHIRSGDAWDLGSAISGGVFTFSQQNWKKQHHKDDAYEDFYYNHRIFLKRSKSDYVFVSGSNAVANLNLNIIKDNHDESGKDITVIYKEIPREIYGEHSRNKALVIEDGSVVKQFDYTSDADLDNIDVNLDAYILKVDTLLDIIDRAQADGVYEEMNTLIKKYLADYSSNAYESTGFIAEIDTIEDYYRANMNLLEERRYRNLFYEALPVLTKTKNGTPTYYAKDADVKKSIIATDTKIEGNVKGSILGRKVSVGADSKVEDSIILQSTTIGKNVTIQYAILDKNVVVEDGAKVIGSPDNIKVIARDTVVSAD